MRLLFVTDPLETLQPDHDSTVAIMEAAQRRHAEVWVAGVADLVIDGIASAVWARPVRIAPAFRSRAGGSAARERWWRAGEQQRLELGMGDVVFMRVDPPVDDAYLRATYLLDAAVRAGALVLNAPRGLREANEKLTSLNLPDIVPSTVVTADVRDIRDALGRWRVAVAKPLDGAGGRGIIMMRDGDPGLTALIDLVTEQRTRQIVLQEFVPGVTEGDKRIFLLDGEPVGVVNRRAGAGDFRCNLAVGAMAESTTLDADDLEICRRLRPELECLGLVLVGIDVIGGRLTEVNVTSPTGIRDIERLSDERPSERILDWTMEKLAAGAQPIRPRQPERVEEEDACRPIISQTS
ncbi:glutathione synthase [Nesterenkonia xinjiangensis]|uniref:Glutathione synthetase n=2 Tax=Nesterenkonia xinjiangensis TaxID=225327 RepID=A0A7Z0GJR8_9MICC|nr:glutathione synthase [Nesterenkonia xinjiangensis]NYJ76719.1 glutathione synthase [Nesterenkonia xinjiangensis]